MLGPYRGVERVTSHYLMNMRRGHLTGRHKRIQTLDNELRARKSEHISTTALRRDILRQ